MLVIQPTTDGRLRIFNNHRSDYARDESSARTLAYNWGHTDISINKALSEMRSASRGEAEPGGWRVTRTAPAPEKSEPAPRAEPTTPVAERRPRARKVPAPPVAPAPPAKATPAKQPAAKEPAGKEAAAKAAPVRKPASNTVLAPAKPAAPAAKAPAKPRAKAAPVAAAPPAKTTAKAVARAPVKAAAKAPAKTPTRAPARAAAKAPAKEPAPKQAPKPATAPREKALSLFRSGVKELAGMEEATLAFARGPWSELREMAEYITACLEGKRPKTGWERK